MSLLLRDETFRPSRNCTTSSGDLATGTFILAISGLGPAGTTAVTSAHPSAYAAEGAGRFTPDGQGPGSGVSTGPGPDKDGKSNVVEGWVAPQGTLAFRPPPSGQATV